MDNLKKATILYINQVRQDNFDTLIGKGFSEAFAWKNVFKRIIFICYSSTNKYIFKKKYDNCYLIGIPFELSPDPLKSLINLGRNYLKLYLFLLKLIKRTNISIIRMENLLLSGFPIFFFSLTKKIPFIIWLGGNEKEALFSKYDKNLFTLLLSKLISIIEIIILKKANFVFPVTDELYKLSEKKNVINKILSPNYVDLTKFLNKDKKYDLDGKIIAMYVGRFEEEKGIKILFNSIKILSKFSDDIEFLIVGDGSLKGWIQNFIIKNNIKNVNLLGKFSHEEMPNIYKLANIFVLPSYTEGSPASLIEAMSCGIASIATSVGESKKIIENELNGLLIPPGDPNKLAEAFKYLIANKNLIKKFGEQGRDKIIKYTKNYIKIHKFVYERILIDSKSINI